jgi:hypothetical protein
MSKKSRMKREKGEKRCKWAEYFNNPKLYSRSLVDSLKMRIFASD